MRSTLLVVIALAGAGTAAAQHVAGTAPEQLGTVHFETSCRADVRGDFDRAVALLHSFEFQAAMEAFTGVLERDPACAVAYWGIALCHWGNPFAGLKAGPPLERGAAAAAMGLTTGSPTARERAYIAAAAELFKDAATSSHRERTLAYARAMEALQRRFLDDTEATIFSALAVNQTALPTDKTYSAQLKAAALLEPLFKQHPDHPGLAHYIIHAYDHPPLASKALDAARSYAKIAPSAPHALHMPSHTFTRVGYWMESIETNRASERTAVEHGVMAEALHAMDYQKYAYLQIAQDQNAAALLDRLPAVLARFDPTAMGGAAPPFAGVFAAAAIPARYALERGMWGAAAALRVAPSSFPHADAITHFTRALGAARSGAPASAAPDLAQLAVLRDRLKTAQDAYWTDQVEVQSQVAAAWVTFAAGKRDEGIQRLRAAADLEDATDKSAVTPGPLAPARELLGEMLLEAGRAAEALAAFETSMQKEPGRLRGAHGAARAAEAAGNRAEARKYYERMLEIARTADTERPELQQARAFVKKS
jgi:tetratricopeptide (TPR) repeat protein